VIVKWAQSSDGFLSRTDGKRWITNAASRKDVHKIRSKVGAILVGVNTVIEDNPMLTARPDRGRQPLRIVLGKISKIPKNCYLLKTAKKWPVCVFNGRNLNDVLVKLGKKGIGQLLVEGGEKIITSFLKQKLADEIIVYTSNEKLGAKGKVPSSQTMKAVYNRLKKNHSDKKQFNTDIRLTGLTS